MLRKMQIRGLVFDAYHGVYILVLHHEDDSGVLPIRIEKADAQALGLALEGVFTQRPLTHDLFKNILDTLGAKMLSAVICDLKEEIYYAKIHLVYRDAEFAIDARPSDAVVMALRMDVPVFVAEGVIEQQNTGEIDRWLGDLKPEDFGRHSM